MNARATRTRHLLAALAIAAAVLGATSCSSSGSDSSKDASSSASVSVDTRADSGTTEADLKKAAEALAAANLDASANSYAYLSSSCKAKFSSAEWANNQKLITEGLKGALPAMATAKVGTVTVRNVTPVSGEAQVLLVGTDGAPIVPADQATWSKWMVEEGSWVVTDCSSAKELLGGS